MINLRSTLICSFFAVLTIVVILMAQDVKKNKEAYTDLLDIDLVDESKFKNMTYYSLQKEKKNLTMKSEFLTIINQESFLFESTKGEFFDKNGKSTVFETDKGEYDSEAKLLSFNEGVDLETDDAKYKADHLILNQVKETLEASGNVISNVKDLKTEDELNIVSNSMFSNLKTKISYFNGKVKGKLSRKRRYEGGFTFGSEKMELNQLESLIKLSKDVNLQRSNYDVEAQRAEIFLENYNKRLKYYVLYDDIKFVEKLDLKSGETRTRKAYAEKMEGFIAEAKIILSGAPRVEQDGDLLKGYQITLRENVEFVEVDDSQSNFQLKRK